MKYFVSYTTRDKEVTFDLLKSFSYDLGKTGEVFIDIIDNDSIDKQARVISELDSSDLFILIESKLTYESEWVFFELERAMERQIPIKKISIADINDFKSYLINDNCHCQEEAQLVTKAIPNKGFIGILKVNVSNEN